MKKACDYLALDLKIYTIVIFLLAGCDTNSPKTNQVPINNSPINNASINNKVAQQLSSTSHSVALSSVAPSSPSVFSSSISVSKSSKASSQQSSIVLNTNKPTSLTQPSSIFSSSTVSVANSSPSNIRNSVNALSTSSSTSALKAPLVGISGVIKLTGKNGEVLSPEGVIVNLEPTSSNDEAVSNQEKRQYDVQMKNKTYLPKFMTVRKNDQVNFSNNDKIKHNVFSTSAGNGFDLGTFGKGGKNNTVLKTPGIVKVYCNIHPEMAFFISVSQHNYSYITNESGAYEINNLPPGEYRLSAWHIRGEIQQVVNLQMPMSKRDILINTESYVSTSHKNKFGEDYKITPALFKDEFY